MRHRHTAMQIIATLIPILGQPSLTFQSPEGQIRWGTQGSQGILRASCEADVAGISWLAPSSFDGIPEGNITVEYQNVPPTCVNVPINVPCAAHDPAIPPRFWCTFTGAAGEISTGPVHGFRVEILASTGALLALPVRSSCTLPTWDQVVGITGYCLTAPCDGTASFNLSIAYLEQDGQRLPFVGGRGGETLHLSGLPSPPSAPSPLVPPLPPSPPDPLWVGSVQMSASGATNGYPSRYHNSGDTSCIQVVLSRSCKDPQLGLHQHSSADTSIQGMMFVTDLTGTVLGTTGAGGRMDGCKDCFLMASGQVSITLQAHVGYFVCFHNNPGGDMSGPSTYGSGWPWTVTDGNMRATFSNPRYADYSPGQGVKLPQPGDNLYETHWSSVYKIVCSA